MNTGRKELRTREVRFLAEQDGSPEQLLKHQLVSLFQGVPRVEQAYLVRGDFGIGTPEAVFLCLRSDPSSKEELVTAVGRVFASIFSTQMHLDIVFVDRELEEKVSRVCPPFFQCRTD